MSWGRGLGSGSGAWWGAGFPVENEGKGVGRVGDGVGASKEPASQCASFVETIL